MTHSEMDQQRHGYLRSEPCILFRGSKVSQPNMCTVVTASGHMNNLHSHYLPDNVMMYGVTQYTGIQHQHNLNMGVPAAANLFYFGMNPSSSTVVLPLPLNHRASDQLTGSSTFAVSEAYKRKNAELIGGNYWYFNASASSLVAPPNVRHIDGIAMMDTGSFSLSQYSGNGIPSLVEVGPHGSSWSRSGELFMVHDHNHLIRGNYLRQHFQPAAPPWLDLQLNSNNNDGHTTAWNQSFPMPYVQAPNFNGTSVENANMGLQRSHDTASNRNGLRFPHPPLVNPQHHNYHHPTLPMQGMRGHNINFHPTVTAESYRVPTNPSNSAAAQNDFEMGGRHVGPVPLRTCRPHRGVMTETTHVHRNLPPMGYLQVDDVALLDEVGNLVDHHRDMRLDIDGMSYEELLALGERIGNVSRGLSEEIITTQMKIKCYLIPSTAINLDEEASEDQETDTCIICQDEYKNREKIGILQCGHDYHAYCLRKWLLVKNVCPICKSEALTPGAKGV